MNKKIQPCDVQSIESFLNDQLEANEREQFLVHLESCDSCRTALAGEAADPEFWNEAAGLLGDTTTGFEPVSDLNGDCGDEVPRFSIRTILDWLSPTDDPEMLGRIGEYEISGVVGVGGMGAVLKGFDKSLLRVVAIKVMAPHLANHGSARHRFEREARAAAAISHDNVVDIYCVAEMNGLPYLVMPFARGPSLQKRIDEGGPLTAIEVIQVGRQIASGLAAAHEQGLVHRDIKPANILLNDGIERLLITDFGVARAMDDASMTQTGLIAGTPQFMSPEQARGESVDHRSDLFSLGSVLYTACTGRPPFRADAPFAVLRKITDVEPRPIREINPEIPAWLENTIHCLLEKERSGRFDDAKQVAELFEKCLAHLRQPTQTDLPNSIAQLKANNVSEVKGQFKLTARMLGIIMSAIAFVVLGSLAFFQLTDAPDISGTWKGESWNNIKLSSVKEANHWYAGSFTDTEGQKGVIHLEWSPIRRRFNGRWSIGSSSTGTIVLRSGQIGSVRGAILMDSQGAPSDEAQLRDFVWHPSEAFTQNNNLRLPRHASDRAMTLDSPVSGVVKKVGNDIRNGLVINKGDLVIEIQTDKANARKAERRLLESRIQNARHKASAYSMNVVSFQEARDYAINASTELATAAEARYQSKVNSIPGLSALEQQARLSYERQSKLHKSGFVTEAQVEDTKAKWDVATSNLKAAQSDAKTLKSEWNAKIQEIEEKKRTTQAKIDHAMAMQQDAESQVATLVTELNDFDAQAVQAETVRVRAPIGGMVSGWQKWKLGEKIEAGTILLELRSAEAAELGGLQQPPLLSDAKPSSGSFELQSVPALLKLASDLQKRLRETNARLAANRPEMERQRAEVETYSKSVEKIEASLASESDEKLRAKLSSSLNQNRAELSFKKRLVKDLEAAVANDQAKLNLAESELVTITDLMRLELESQTKQLQQAGKTVELQRARYKRGDLTLLEVQQSEVRLQQLQTRVRQLEHVLEHFQQIKPDTK